MCGGALCALLYAYAPPPPPHTHTHTPRPSIPPPPSGDFKGAFASVPSGEYLTYRGLRQPGPPPPPVEPPPAVFKTAAASGVGDGATKHEVQVGNMAAVQAPLAARENSSRLHGLSMVKPKKPVV